MQVSVSRKQQISDELAKLGIEATDEAIESVLAILKSNGRATVKSACKKVAGQFQQASTKGQKATGQLNGKLRDVADNLKTNIKKQIVSTAIKRALEDFKNGDFGDLDDIALGDLDEAIDIEYSLLEVSDLDPKYALPSNNSRALLSAALEQS